MFFKGKKKEKEEGGVVHGEQPNGVTTRNIIRIGSVSSGASTEQLDQIAANKQKIPSLFRLLAEHKLSEKEIWEGDPMLFAILYQFKEHLNKTDSAPNIITFHLPSIPEFGDIKKKSYKINKKFSIAQTISLICKKQMIPDPKRFWIGSLQGFIMNDTETLASYGLSSLFESWELRLIVKEDILSKSPYRYQPLESIGTEFIVVFELPPLEQFNGLKRHVVKVDSGHTIKQTIANICKKYKVENPDRFSVMTIDENPLVEFALFGGACFKHYGLGYKFKKWDLKIVFNDLIPPYVHKHTVIPLHGWTQVSPGQLDPYTARTIINDLENKCVEYQAIITQLQKDIEGGNEVSAAHVREIERLREENKKLLETLEEERESTSQQNEVYEKRLESSNAEIESQSGQMKTMKAKIDELSHQLSQLKIVHEETTNNLVVSRAEKDSLQVQFEEATAEIADYQQKLLLLRAQSAQSESNLTSMIATLEKEKIAIKEEAKLSFERIATEKASSEESSKHLQASQALLCTQLQDDIVSLQREREIMQLSVQKATVDRQEAVVLQEKAEKKMVEMQSEKKRVERQFGDLERERDVLRQQVQIKVDEIQDVQKDLEWSRETIAELERRLANMTGEVKMFKDIKDKEVQKAKKSCVSETQTKSQLDKEKQNTLEIQTRLNKKINELESARKAQEQAFKNAEQAFKKVEGDLKRETEDYRQKYEQLRISISNGTIKEGTNVPALPAAASSNPNGSSFSLGGHKASSANKDLNDDMASSPVLIGGVQKSQEDSSAQNSSAHERRGSVDADGLYNSLQNRFQHTVREGVEELELSDNE
ncbi:hypothetical protein CYY_005782 [Polysphondylium violaceum]|uniref:Ubiquitin-like domain-containing protein n=1 Tax=Polysphondylium violaceum TaxID=133409 RepID=A0A8J4V3T3_9MYCE|nr:hypothetical protein CYY_005782 [Polysphondylium violaceum]